MKRVFQFNLILVRFTRTFLACVFFTSIAIGQTFSSKDINEIKNRLKGCAKKDPAFASKIDYLISKVKPSSSGADPSCAVPSQTGALASDQYHFFTGIVQSVDEYAGTQVLEVSRPETTSVKVVVPYTSSGQAKAGFGIGKDAKEDAARKFHDALMAEDRKMCFRNYVYYTQRFNFAEGAEFDTKWVDGMNDKKIKVEGNLLNETDQFKNVSHYERAADNFFQAYGWDPVHTGARGALLLSSEEANRLGKVANAEIQRIKKTYPKNQQRLSVDQVYERLAPYLQDAGFSDVSSGYTVSAKKNEFNPLPHGAPNAGGELQAAKRQREGQLDKIADYENAPLKAAINKADQEQNDISILLHSPEFSTLTQTQLGKLTKDQVKAKLKKSLTEKVKATTDYAKEFIQGAQANSNMWGRRDADDYAELQKSLLFSSPLAIQKVASEHPEWLSALCLPLSKAEKLGKSELPGWIDFGGGMLGVIDGFPGAIAATTFGFYASSMYHEEKKREIANIESHAGVNGVDPRSVQETDVNQGSDDKGLLAKAKKEEDDAVFTDVAKVAFSSTLGVVVPGAGRYIFKGAEEVAIRTLATKALQDAGEPVTQASIDELIELAGIAKKRWGRDLTPKELIEVRNKLKVIQEAAAKARRLKKSNVTIQKSQIAAIDDGNTIAAGQKINSDPNGQPIQKMQSSLAKKDVNLIYSKKLREDGQSAYYSSNHQVRSFSVKKGKIKATRTSGKVINISDEAYGSGQVTPYEVHEVTHFHLRELDEQYEGGPFTTVLSSGTRTGRVSPFSTYIKEQSADELLTHANQSRLFLRNKYLKKEAEISRIFDNARKSGKSVQLADLMRAGKGDEFLVEKNRIYDVLSKDIEDSRQIAMQTRYSASRLPTELERYSAPTSTVEDFVKRLKPIDKEHPNPRFVLYGNEASADFIINTKQELQLYQSLTEDAKLLQSNPTPEVQNRMQNNVEALISGFKQKAKVIEDRANAVLDANTNGSQVALEQYKKMMNSSEVTQQQYLEFMNNMSKEGQAAKGNLGEMP